MKIEFLVSLLALITLSSCELPAPNRGYLPPKWLNKQQFRGNHRLPPGTFVIQVRSDSGRPKLILKRGPPPFQSSGRFQSLQQTAPPHRFVKPVKLALSPQFLNKPIQPFISNGRKPVRVTRYKFNLPKIPQGYMHEKPFSPTPILSNHLADSFQFNQHFGPIHTIPAPNLATSSGITGNPFQFNGNHNSLHQYQVTEEISNDQTIHDPYSGQLKYFAPDPDPSLPVRKIPQALDAYSMPSDPSTFPPDIQHNYLPPAQKLTRVPSTAYGVPFENGQLPNLVDGMPLSVFNPSYLVSQSKNLYNQHKKQLFNPAESSTVSSSSYGTEDQTQHIASDGQIFHAAPNTVETAVVTPSPIEFNGLEHIVPHVGAYAALLAQSPLVQPIPTQPSLSSAVTVSYETQTAQPNISPNFGDPVGQGGFVVSNYFGVNGHEGHGQLLQAQGQQDIQFVTPANHIDGQSNPQQNLAPNHNPYYVDISHHQLQNQQTLELANQQLEQQQQFSDHHGGQEYATSQNNEQDLSEFTQHQQLLQKQLGAVDLQNQAYSTISNLHKRSEKYSKEKERNKSDSASATSQPSSKEK